MRLTKPQVVSALRLLTGKLINCCVFTFGSERILPFRESHISEELIKAVDSFPQNNVRIHICTIMLINFKV